MIVFFLFAAGVNSFNFETYFEGNWSVVSTRVDRSSGRVVSDDAEPVDYVVRKNADGGLIGFYTPHNRVVNLKVEFSEGSTSEGSFFTSNNNAASWSPLFSFAFEPLSNKVIASRGAWTASSTRGTYQFIVTSDSTFVLIVDDANWSTTLSASKAVQATEQSFFSKYGMMIGMMIFMIVTQVMKARMAPNAPPATAAGPTAVQAVPRKKDN